MRPKNIIIFIAFLTIMSCSKQFKSGLIPERIILNLTENPSTSIAVTWRTKDETKKPLVQIAESTAGIELEKSLTSYNADMEKFKLINNEIVYHYSSVIRNLEPNTKYAYRVGSDLEWSEWNQFITSSNEDTPFEFIYFGDPQDKIKEYCSRIFREAYKKVPDASFWLFGGDLTSEPVDSLWNEFFYAAGFTFRVTPSIMAAGNHDHLAYFKDNIKHRYKTISPIWKAHFTLPENGLDGLEEVSYSIDYQGVRFIVLESYARREEQAKWMDNILKDNPNRWTIVSFHHPLYSTSKGRDNKATRETFLPIFDKYNVDLVLQGHDHTYGRTHKLVNSEIVDNNEPGTVYIVSGSGPKFYDLNPLYDGLMAKMGSKIQLFQAIKIEKDKLTFKAYTATGELFDSFELEKN